MEWGRLVARRFIQVGLSRWLITWPRNSRQKYCDLCDPRSARFNFVVTLRPLLANKQLFYTTIKTDYIYRDLAWPNCKTIKPVRNTIRPKYHLNEVPKQNFSTMFKRTLIKTTKDFKIWFSLYFSCWTWREMLLLSMFYDIARGWSNVKRVQIITSSFNH